MTTAAAAAAAECDDDDDDAVRGRSAIAKAEYDDEKDSVKTQEYLKFFTPRDTQGQRNTGLDSKMEGQFPCEKSYLSLQPNSLVSDARDLCDGGPEPCSSVRRVPAIANPNTNPTSSIVLSGCSPHCNRYKVWLVPIKSPSKN